MKMSMKSKVSTRGKVTDSDVISIRMYGAKSSAKTLANKFKVTTKTINNIVGRWSYNSVPENKELYPTGFSNYELTADGRVWSTKSNKFLKSNRNGRVTLHSGSFNADYRIHKLMDEYFPA